MRFIYPIVLVSITEGLVCLVVPGTRYISTEYALLS